jgi:hypothetical protein
MTSFVARQTIARSADDVWAYSADIVRHPEWMTVTDARVLAGPGTRAGAHGRVRMRFGPFGLWRLIGPIVAAEGKAGPERELQRLKAQVEGRP